MGKYMLEYLAKVADERMIYAAEEAGKRGNPMPYYGLSPRAVSAYWGGKAIHDTWSNVIPTAPPPVSRPALTYDPPARGSFSRSPDHRVPESAPRPYVRKWKISRIYHVEWWRDYTSLSYFDIYRGSNCRCGKISGDCRFSSRPMLSSLLSGEGGF
jgi:hypothetical protein